MSNNKGTTLRQGSVVVITGASSGLGKQLALSYSKKNIRLIITGRQEVRLNQTKKLCGPNCQVQTFLGDLTNEETCKKLIDLVSDKFSRIDLLILNAGVNAHFKFSQLKDTNIFDQIMKTNFYSNVYLTKFSLPLIRKSKGTIVAISSLSGKFGLPMRSAYCASKFALTGFFESLRTEQENISIILVYPTSLNTPMRTHDLLHSVSSQNNSKQIFDSKKCAQKIVQEVNKKTEDIYIPFKGHLGVYIQPFFPKFLRNKLKDAAKL